jgi:hypothetical protein
MGQRHDTRFFGVNELVMRTLDTVEFPTVGFQFPNHIQAFHGVDYNHPAVIINTTYFVPIGPPA